MGGKARQLALKTNQQVCWVRKHKTRENTYHVQDGYRGGPLSKATLYHDKHYADFWLEPDYKSVKVVVTIMEAKPL